MRSLIPIIIMMVCFTEGALGADRGVLGPGHYDKVTVGMTPNEVYAAYPDKVERDRPYEPDETCYYLILRSPNGVGFMITDGIVSRIDIAVPEILTLEGIQVGDSEEKARSTYKDAIIEPHHYVAPDGFYLTVRHANPALGTRFETFEGKITSFYTGRFPELTYVEGCE
jgi:hypothetical protein